MCLQMSLTLPRRGVSAVLQHWRRLPRILPHRPLPLPAQRLSFPIAPFSCGESPLFNSAKTSATSVSTKKMPPVPSKSPMSALRYKTGKTSKRKGGPGLDAWSVVGYSTAEAIDLVGLQEELSIMKEEKQEMFTQVPSVFFSILRSTNWDSHGNLTEPQ